MSSHRLLVALVSLVFTGFLLWKFRPLGLFSASPAVGEDVRRARDRVRLARTPRERAEALVLTAEAAARDPRHLTAAIGYLLRAMRADPVWPEPVLVARGLLEKQRPHVLESLLWRRLAHVPWSGETAGAARCAAEGLVALYGKALRDRERAAALRKLVERLGSA